MFKFSVEGKEYSVKYDYRALARTDVMRRAQGLSQVDDFGQIVQDLGEFLLVGLQKYHKDEFGFDTDAEREVALDKVFTLLDKLDEEGQSVLGIFNEVSEELMANRFLSEMLNEEPKKTNSKKK